MTRLIATGAALLAGLAATQATAFDFAGGNVEFAYYSETENGVPNYDTMMLKGSAAVAFGSGMGAQLDVSAFRYSGSDFEYAAGVHGYYELSPSTTVGVFYNADFWGGGSNTNSFYGAEIAFDAGGDSFPVSVEAYLGRYDDRATIFGALGTYTINDNWSVNAGGIVSDWSGFYYNMIQAGARYDMASGLYVSGNVSSYFWSGSSDDIAIGVQVGWDFGGGAKFSRRNYTSIYNGD